MQSRTTTVDIWDWQNAPGEAPHQVFAIGDVHGRADLLATLHVEIAREARPDALVVHLGDFIDRGPQSIEALKLALDGIRGLRVVNLPGNHEQFLVAAMLAPRDRRFEIVDAWLDNGGRAVARELGLEVAEGDHRAQDRLLDAVRSALGARRIEQLTTLPNHVFAGRYLFVHAGIHPEMPVHEFLSRPWQDLTEDEDRDPLWIRWPFFGHDGPFGDDLIVVHGHTPRDEPELMTNRLNLDTRAFDSGRLTMVELDGRRMRIFQTRGAARRPGSSELEFPVTGR